MTSLAEEFDVIAVAAAAVKQADTRPDGDPEQDIPAPAVYRDARPAPRPARRSR